MSTSCVRIGAAGPVDEGAALQVTTQDLEKVHRMEGERSARRLTDVLAQVRRLLGTDGTGL